MADIAALCEHRTKLLAMKMATLVDRRGGALYASSFDKDIQRIDLLIELAINKTPPTQQGE